MDDVRERRSSESFVRAEPSSKKERVLEERSSRKDVVLGWISLTVLVVTVIISFLI